MLQSFFKRITILIALFLFAVGVLVGIQYWQKIYGKLSHLSDKDKVYVYVHTGAKLDEVVADLKSKGIIEDEKAFLWLCEMKKYKGHILPGRYQLKPGMTKNDLVNMLRAGIQEPVRVIFNSVHTKEQLAGVLAKQLEPDSAAFMEMFNSERQLAKIGFTPNNIISMFLPNSYELYWNTSVEKFMKKMAKEYTRFWTSARKEKAKKLGFTQVQAVTLASIVQGEQSRHNAEKAKIAGLYLNRLKIGMPLQSDPTVIFALKDFSRKRLSNEDLKVSSPYNTYINQGLPPGPVNLPEVSSIDAVLNPVSHSYIYMCAKEDLSGYHNFAASYPEHLVYARRYQEALNKLNIKH